MDDVRAFAGDDPDRAHYYKQDEGFLLEFPKRVMHFEVVAS